MRKFSTGFELSFLALLISFTVWWLGSAERIGLEIEKLPDGRSMIYIPSAPSAWSGVTQILPAEQITYIDVPATTVMELTEKYGHGVDSILGCKQKNSSPDE